MKTKIAPSIFAADFANLESEIAALGSVDMLHLDIMDGHFVPNISFGPTMVESIRRITAGKIPLDVHLMIENPLKYIPIFAKAVDNAPGSIIVFHIETTENPQEIIAAIKSLGLRAGIALKPHTPAEKAKPYLNQLDMVLQMTVEPGFSGQAMIPAAIENIRLLRQWAPNLDIQVDGGVTPETAPILKQAGANILVAGNAIFKSPDYPAAIAQIIPQSSP